MKPVGLEQAGAPLLIWMLPVLLCGIDSLSQWGALDECHGGTAQMTSMAIVRNSKPALDGLSIEETIEFEVLDALAALDDTGKPAWTFEGGPTTHREKRWLEYTKQIQARRRKNSGTPLNRNTIYVRPAFRSRSK